MSTAVQRAALAAGEGIDRFFVRTVLRRRRPSGASIAADALTRFDDAARFYASCSADGALFAPPRRAEPTERVVRELAGGAVVDVSWASGFAGLQAGYRELLERVPESARTQVRWFRHELPAPAFVAVHGWGAGYYPLEERAFWAQRLYRAGLDVLLFTLPFHARRASSRFSLPPFPSADPVRTNEAFVHAIDDLRALVRLLRERGAASVGVGGMSLGGFTTALLATVEPELDFAVPIIAVACVPDLMWRIGAGTPARVRAERLGLTKERFAQAFAATQPLLRTPTIAPERVLVIAGARDCVVPAEHAGWLRAHFGAGRTASFAGAHLVQIGREEALRALLAFLRELEIVPPSRRHAIATPG